MWPPQVRDWTLHFFIVNEFQLRQPHVAGGSHQDGTSTDGLSEKSANGRSRGSAWVEEGQNGETGWYVIGQVCHALSPPRS